MPDAGVLATILLILGLFLLALELMIPSFGVIGIMAAICLIVSAWSAWQAWWGTSPGFFWTYAGFWLVGIPSVLGGVMFLLQNTRMGDYVVLRGPTNEEVVPLADERSRMEALVGQLGAAASLLTPGGMVTVQGARFHAESSGLMIEPGTPVEVIGVRATRLVVKAASPERVAALKAKQAAAENEALADASDNESGMPETALAQSSRRTDDAGVLDFEIPDQ
jgi:membrane-bound ClpP family serine protease